LRGKGLTVEIRPAGWRGTEVGPYARAVRAEGGWQLVYLRPGMEKWRERLIKAYFSEEPAPPELSAFSDLLSMPRRTEEEVLATNILLSALNMEAVILGEREEV